MSDTHTKSAAIDAATTNTPPGEAFPAAVEAAASAYEIGKRDGIEVALVTLRAYVAEVMASENTGQTVIGVTIGAQVATKRVEAMLAGLP